MKFVFVALVSAHQLWDPIKGHLIGLDVSSPTIVAYIKNKRIKYQTFKNSNVLKVWEETKNNSVVQNHVLSILKSLNFKVKSIIPVLPAHFEPELELKFREMLQEINLGYFRAVFREYGALQSNALDKLSVCLKSTLLIAHLYQGKETILVQKPKVFAKIIQKNVSNDKVTDVVLSSPTELDLIKIYPNARIHDADAEYSAIKSAGRILLQQYRDCECKYTDFNLIRCEVIRTKYATRVIPATQYQDLGIKFDLKRKYFFGLLETKTITIHEEGFQTDSECILRPKASDLRQRNQIKIPNQTMIFTGIGEEVKINHYYVYYSSILTSLESCSSDLISIFSSFFISGVGEGCADNFGIRDVSV